MEASKGAEKRILSRPDSELPATRIESVVDENALRDHFISHVVEGSEKDAQLRNVETRMDGSIAGWTRPNLEDRFMPSSCSEFPADAKIPFKFQFELA